MDCKHVTAFIVTNHAALVTLLVDGITVILFVSPTPLNSAIVLGVVEAGDSVEKTGVDSASREGCEFCRSILTSGDLAFVPKTPLSTRVKSSDVATLGTHENVVVNHIVLISQREEVGTDGY